MREDKYLLKTLSQTKLEGEKVRRTTAVSERIAGWDVMRSEISGLQAMGTEICESRFTESTIHDSELIQTRFEGCIFHRMTFSRVVFRSVEFARCTFHECRFEAEDTGLETQVVFRDCAFLNDEERPALTKEQASYYDCYFAEPVRAAPKSHVSVATLPQKAVEPARSDAKPQTPPALTASGGGRFDKLEF